VVVAFTENVRTPEFKVARDIGSARPGNVIITIITDDRPMLAIMNLQDEA